MSNQSNRINQLERLFIDSSADPGDYADRLARHSDSGITADEIIAEARWIHSSIGPPFTTKRFAEFAAAEAGISVATLLERSENLRVEMESRPPA